MFVTLAKAALLLSLAFACVSLPAQYYMNRPYFLHRLQECKGTKVYEINNVRDIEQCKNACIQFDCAAVNLYQLSEFGFMCEILDRVWSIQSAQGAACYAAQDGNDYNGVWGKRK